MRYAVAGENLTHRQIVQVIAETLGRNPDDVVALGSTEYARAANTVPCHATEFEVIDGELAARTAYLDFESAAEALRYSADDVRSAIRATVRLAVEQGLTD